MIKVLFVCLGNICRSPLAEAIFKDLLHRKGLIDKVYCASSGTSNYHIGSCPDPRTLKNAQLNNIQVEHFAQQFKFSDFENYDYILAMDQFNKEEILKLHQKREEYMKKVFLMRDFELEKNLVGMDVPDPYFGGENGFQQVHDILKRTCSAFLDFIKEKHRLHE